MVNTIAAAGTFESRAAAPATATPLDASASVGTLWHSGPKGVVAVEWTESFVAPTQATPVEAVTATSGGDLEALTGRGLHHTPGFLLTGYELRLRPLVLPPR